MKNSTNHLKLSSIILTLLSLGVILTIIVIQPPLIIRATVFFPIYFLLQEFHSYSVRSFQRKRLNLLIAIALTLVITLA